MTVTDLRAALDEITTALPGAGMDWVLQQRDRVAALATEIPHSISIVELASESFNGNGYINCYMYALRIAAQSVSAGSPIFPNSRFVLDVLPQILSQKPMADCEGDVTLYFNDGALKHAAVLRNGLFQSKWGGRGILAHVWRHGLEEVPSDYGTQYRFFGAPISDAPTKAFITWAGRA